MTAGASRYRFVTDFRFSRIEDTGVRLVDWRVGANSIRDDDTGGIPAGCQRQAGDQEFDGQDIAHGKIQLATSCAGVAGYVAIDVPR